MFAEVVYILKFWENPFETFYRCIVMFVENMPDQMQFEAGVLMCMNLKSVSSYTARSQFVDDGRSFGANTLR